MPTDIPAYADPLTPKHRSHLKTLFRGGGVKEGEPTLPPIEALMGHYTHGLHNERGGEREGGREGERERALTDDLGRLGENRRHAERVEREEVVQVDAVECIADGGQRSSEHAQRPCLCAYVGACCEGASTWDSVRGHREWLLDQRQASSEGADVSGTSTHPSRSGCLCHNGTRRL